MPGFGDGGDTDIDVTEFVGGKDDLLALAIKTDVGMLSAAISAVVQGEEALAGCPGFEEGNIAVPVVPHHPAPIVGAVAMPPVFFGEFFRGRTGPPGTRTDDTHFLGMHVDYLAVGIKVGLGVGAAVKDDLVLIPPTFVCGQFALPLGVGRPKLSGAGVDDLEAIGRCGGEAHEVGRGTAPLDVVMVFNIFGDGQYIVHFAGFRVNLEDAGAVHMYNAGRAYGEKGTITVFV